MKFIEDVLDSLYQNNCIIFKSKRITDLSPEDIDELNNFHMHETILITKNDDYLCGIRANHFCVEIGMSENYEDRIIILVTANHKAFRMMTMMYMRNSSAN